MDRKGEASIIAVVIGIIIVIVVVVIIVAALLFFVGYSKVKVTEGTITGGTINENCKEIETSYEEEYLKTENYTETVPRTETVCE